ncbi:hypothetical protein ACLMJK_009410 [Lecanora helva]
MKRKHCMLIETSEAAEFNAKVLRKLQKVLKAEPEANLLSLIPTEYSERLENKQRPACTGHAVVKCSPTIVAKIVPQLEDFTEYNSMLYLARQGVDIPAPQALGMVTSNGRTYTFMSLAAGTTVDKVWPELDHKQKASIRQQLDNVFLKLRRLKLPRDIILGGVAGEGCKDTRRHTRICQEPISTCAEFENFRFSSPVFGSPVYISLLRVSLNHISTVVFTHGDLRPENIVVHLVQDGDYTITGILDWKKSGFYPDYFECLKATSNMSPSDANDWYEYLPSCASPRTYPQSWLVDRIWDSRVV